MKPRGFILVVLLMLLSLAAVTAFALNSRSGLQLRMVGNDQAAIQREFDLLAVGELTRWQLADNVALRLAGAAWSYNGGAYTRTVENAAVSGYTDAIRITVAAADGGTPLRQSFRYIADTPFVVRQPEQLWIDRFGDLFFADPLNNAVWRIAAANGVITRVAGNGISGYAGDDGPATQARLWSPAGVCTDTSGNLYIADTGNHRIRKVDLDGRITTIAGTGTGGFSGDGGAATSAQLNQPCGLGCDAAGNLYIADSGNQRIRRIAAADGTIATVAGTGIAGNSGDGGPATAAMLSGPSAVALDAAGNLYIADTNNHRIRKVVLATGTITKFAGSGTQLGDDGLATSAKITAPGGVAVDAAGNVFIADTNQQRIRRVDPSSGVITTFAGNGSPGYSGDGGPATAARLKLPASVACRAGGEVVIADTMNSTLRVVSAAGIIATHAVAAAVALKFPDQTAVAYDPATFRTRLLIADTGNHQIRSLDQQTSALETVAGTGVSGSSGDGGPAADARFSTPRGLALAANGDLFIADTGNQRIRKITAATAIVTTVGGTSLGYAGDGGSALLAKFSTPSAIALAANGDLFIADTNNHRIRKITAATGIVTTVAGSGTGGYAGDNGPATSGRLYAPQGVALDAAGNLYIADTLNHRIRWIAAGTTTIRTFAGSGTSGYTGDGGPAISARLNAPQGVSTDAAGNLYIADTGSHVIRVVSAATGVISRLCGVGLQLGFNGDGLPAVESWLKIPTFAIAAGGRAGAVVYVSDNGQNRIRKLSLLAVKELY